MSSCTCHVWLAAPVDDWGVLQFSQSALGRRGGSNVALHKEGSKPSQATWTLCSMPQDLTACIVLLLQVTALPRDDSKHQQGLICLVVMSCFSVLYKYLLQLLCCSYRACVTQQYRSPYVGDYPRINAATALVSALVACVDSRWCGVGVSVGSSATLRWSPTPNQRQF